MSLCLKNLYCLLVIGYVLLFPREGLCQNSIQRWDQFELNSARGVESKGFAIGEGANILDRSAPRRCHFVVSSGSEFTSHYHQNTDYDLSLNPDITYLDEVNRYMSVCMSVKSGYSEGKLEFFMIDPAAGVATQLPHSIEVNGGIPDKPVIRNVPGGRTVVAFAEVSVDFKRSDNHILSRNRAYYIDSSGRRQLEIEFLGQTYSPTSSWGARGPQGIDMTEKGPSGFPAMMSYGEYGTNRIHICELQGHACREKQLILSVELETPVTRIKRNQDGTLSLIVYDAHVFGESEIFLLSEDGTTILARRKIENAGIGTFAKLRGRDLFLIQVQQNKGSEEITYRFFDPLSDWSCSESTVYQHYSANDYIGGYLDADDESAYLIGRDREKQIIQPLDFSSSACSNQVNAGGAGVNRSTY